MLNVQSGVKQGRYSLIVPHDIAYIRRIPAVPNEKQETIRMPDVLQTAVLAAGTTTAAILRLSRFQDLGDSIV